MPLSNHKNCSLEEAGVVVAELTVSLEESKERKEASKDDCELKDLIVWWSYAAVTKYVTQHPKLIPIVIETPQVNHFVEERCFFF